MSDFISSIKITDKDKKDAIAKILFTVIHSTRIMSLNEVLQLLKKQKEHFDDEVQDNQQIEQKLNQNEILAAYSLAKELRISIMSSSNRKLFEYLELDLFSVNEENLLKFINEVVKDIELTNKRNSNAKWSLQVGKIFSRLEGKNPCNENEENEIIKQRSDNSCKSDDKIIDLSKYWEK